MRSLIVLFMMFCCTAISNAQIKGIIVDGENKMPLVGVNIYLQRDSVGIGITDKNGHFDIKSLNRVNVNDTIIFSYIGYLSVRLTLKELEHLNYQIQMHVYSQQLSEITVQGRYGRDFLDYEILESLPRELFSFCSFMEEGKIYVISGNENSYLSDKMFVYDIATDTWKESFKKFIPRFCHAAVYYEGKAFIMGGKCFSTNRRIEYTEPRIEIYDMIKDTVYVDEVNPHQAANPITFVYDNCLYVMGGTIKKNKFSNKIHILDLKTGVWYDSGINIPKERRDNMKGVLVGDIVYFFGGNSINSMWGIRSYNLKTGEWNDLINLKEGVNYPGIAVNGNLIYIYENVTLQIYNVKTNELNAYYFTEGLQNSGLFYAAGKLYIVGGYQQDSDITIDPNTIDSSSVLSVDVSHIGNN